MTANDYESDEEEYLEAVALKAYLKMSPRDAFFDDLWRFLKVSHEPQTDRWNFGSLKAVPINRTWAYTLYLFETETSLLIFWQVIGPELVTLGSAPKAYGNLRPDSKNFIRVKALPIVCQRVGYAEALTWLRENVPALLEGPYPRGKLNRSIFTFP